MTSVNVLGIGLGFHDHVPKQASAILKFHQNAVNALMGNDLRWTGKQLSGSETKSMTVRQLAATLVSA